MPIHPSCKQAVPHKAIKQDTDQTLGSIITITLHPTGLRKSPSPQTPPPTYPLRSLNHCPQIASPPSLPTSYHWARNSPVGSRTRPHAHSCPPRPRRTTLLHEVCARRTRLRLRMPGHFYFHLAFHMQEAQNLELGMVSDTTPRASVRCARV